MRGRSKEMRLTMFTLIPTLETMEITLTIEQEAQLSHISALEGKNAHELAHDVFLRGLQVEALLIAAQPRSTGGREAAARLLEMRQGNMLPEGVSIQDLIRDGRA
jgi:hypothetical protein